MWDPSGLEITTPAGWSGPSLLGAATRDTASVKEKLMRVGFIGLGHMGAGMAGNLIKAGHEVTVYNRTPEKARALVAAGARTARTVSEASQGDAVMTMLANDAAVETLVLGREGVVPSLRPGALHVSSSTISVALSQRLSQEHAKQGQRYVAAPVFGRPDAATAAQLVVVAAGEKTAIEAARPLLEAVGRKVFVIAEEPRAANLVKLSGNFLNASVIESLGEALALITKGGIDRQRYLEILASLFNVPAYNIYGALIASGRFEPAGFAAPLGQKDIRLLLAAAEDLSVAMPVGSLLRDRFLTLMAQGGERLDWSAIGALPAHDAGLVSA
jgi:3-hydroxyisobutyrate dehydrogenase-like beta-hydroxyacid dehydrogenase